MGAPPTHDDDADSADVTRELEQLTEDLTLVGALPPSLRLDIGVMAALWGDVPIGIAVLDREGRYLAINESLAAINGPTVQQHLGRTVEQVLGEGVFDVRRIIDEVIATGRPQTADDLNVADGTGAVRTWRTTWLPCRDGGGAGSDSGIVVLASDVTDEVKAMARTERELDRWRLLSRTDELLSAALSVTETLERTVELLVTSVADWAIVHLVEDDGSIGLAALGHRDPDRTPALRELFESIEVRTDHPFGAGAVIRTGVAQHLPRVTDDVVAAVAAAGGEGHAFAEALVSARIGGCLVLPLVARGRVLGALSICREQGQAITDADQSTVRELVTRASLALDNAVLFARQRETSLSLQHALLPKIPPRHSESLEVATIYSPAAQGAEVGGDWYDVLLLGDDRALVVVGDVMGHDMRAAALMGQLRTAIRAYSHLDIGVAATASLLDDLMRELDGRCFATAVLAQLDVRSGDLEVVRAGHLPPVVLHDGRSAPLDVPVQPPLGLGARRTSSVVRLEVGDVLATYTDGLVESRPQDVDRDVERLCRALETGPDALDGLSQHLLATLGSHDTQLDDIALALLRRRPGGRVEVIPEAVPPTS